MPWMPQVPPPPITLLLHFGPPAVLRLKEDGSCSDCQCAGPECKPHLQQHGHGIWRVLSCAWWGMHMLCLDS